MWLLWSGLSSLRPSQHSAKRTCSRRNEPGRSGHVGTVLERPRPDATPQLQDVTRMLCGLVALASPAITAGRSGTGRARRASLAGSRRSPRREAPSPTPGRAAAPSTRRRRSGGGRSSSRRGASPKDEKPFVVRFPTNVCRYEAPGWPGNAIGSSRTWWLERQLSPKFTPARSARESTACSFPFFGFPPASAAGPGERGGCPRARRGRRARQRPAQALRPQGVREPSSADSLRPSLVAIGSKSATEPFAFRGRSVGEAYEKGRMHSARGSLGQRGRDGVRFRSLARRATCGGDACARSRPTS